MKKKIWKRSSVTRRHKKRKTQKSQNPRAPDYYETAEIIRKNREENAMKDKERLQRAVSE